ncbi:hypothetical protein B7463_g9531, partial [Scytalidium lignicola]
MRLINTSTGLLEEFIGDDIPRYAILSHTWEKYEISLQELQRIIDPDLANDPKTQAVRAKAGFIKILRFVELAASKGVPYAWADTCCIDKTSSADLTESINSMYRWYKNSSVCFAYLADVVSCEWPNYPSDSEVTKSRWFTRGWTLQELIAPSTVEFYNTSWVCLGHKYTKVHEIERITGINRHILKVNDLSTVNIAQKMSWAANRTTTRKEDMAYCLLGIFDVNMPLLYGEGENAFIRLQEHIAATSTDHSLFAWGVGVRENVYGATRSEREKDDMRLHQNIFARSPADFAECGEMESIICVQPDTWMQTNRGLHAIFPTIPTELAKKLIKCPNNPGCSELPHYIDDSDYLAILNCGKRHGAYVHDLDYVVGIWITKIYPRDDNKHGYCRISDYIATLEEAAVFEMHPNTFPKMDMWMSTSQTLKVHPKHFSKRLAGFLLTSKSMCPEIHGLYAAQVGYNYFPDRYPLRTPHLPLETLGGLVGVASFRVNHVNGEESEEEFAVVFGYPPSVKKPFAVIVDDFDPEAPLNYDLQRFGPFEMDQVESGWHTSYRYDKDRLSTFISVTLATVLQKDMIFTELRMESALEEV